MNNNLQCIYLNEMTKTRDPYIHSQQPMNSPPSRASMEPEEEHGWHPSLPSRIEEMTDEECLKEIFGTTEDSTIPPCTLKRTSTEQDANWTPVEAAITPMSSSVGLLVDGESASTINAPR